MNSRVGASVEVVSRGDGRYPDALNDLDGPPRELHAIGNLSVLEGSPDRLVAIVGTRDASSYGVRVARALARAFVEAGAVVVSGMARGVDAAAHDGALAAGGPTVAVLGTGVDVPYPVGNRALHRAVAAAGLVISESPPGTAAFPGCFPRRNRIIAALSRLTIVVEAGHKSGALNTASQALELGRLVAAVPGPIDAQKSIGANTLIRDGAHVITSIDDALGLLGLSRKATPPRSSLGQLDAEIWDRLANGELPIDAIADQTGAPVRAVLEAVGRLEVIGLVGTQPNGTVVRVTVDGVGPAIPAGAGRNVVS